MRKDPTWHPPAERLVSRGGLVLMVAVALVANIAVRAEVANVAALLAVVGVATVLWRSTPLRVTPMTIAMTAIAVGSSLGLMVRISTWLVALNSLTAIAALGALAMLAGPNPPRFAVNSLLANLARVGGMFYAPVILFEAAKPRTGLCLLYTSPSPRDS